MITVRKRVPRQNLQSFAAGGGVSPGMYSSGPDPITPGYMAPPSAQPTPTPSNPGNYVSSPAPTYPSAGPASSYSALPTFEGGMSASAQGLPGARPATGYTQGPQANQAGSWGAAAEGGGYNPVVGDQPQAIPTGPQYQRASTKGTYGSYTNKNTAAPTQTTTPSATNYMMQAGPGNFNPSTPEIPYSSFYTGLGKQMVRGPETPGNPLKQGNATQWQGQAASGGAIPAYEDGGDVEPVEKPYREKWREKNGKRQAPYRAFDDGGAVPDPGGAIPGADPGTASVDQGGGYSSGPSDPMQNVRAALSAARSQNGLNDQLFQELWGNVGGQQASNMPSKPAGPGGDQPNPNPFPTKTPSPAFGKLSQNDSSQDDDSNTTFGASGGAIPELDGGGPVPADEGVLPTPSNTPFDEAGDSNADIVQDWAQGHKTSVPKPGKGGGGKGGGQQQQQSQPPLPPGGDPGSGDPDMGGM